MRPDEHNDLTNRFVKLERRLRAVSGWLRILGAIVFALLIANDRVALRDLKFELPVASIAVSNDCNNGPAVFDLCLLEIKANYVVADDDTRDDSAPTVAASDSDPPHRRVFGDDCLATVDFVDPECIQAEIDEIDRRRYPCGPRSDQARCLEVELRALGEAYSLGYSDDMFRDFVEDHRGTIIGFAREFSGYDDRDVMLSGGFATRMAARPRRDETAR